MENLLNPDSIVIAIFLAIGAALLSFVKHMHKTNVQARNIRRHGWPPAHCDASGSLRPRDDEEDDKDEEEDEDE